ncbi:YebC/PmpR family DNA-binding transcriptional regulator [Patescibacteria group bacterium]|nr:YebC/PmpR family DNA-binding transcriptional regulator [Patescibacteria group bacterium]MBU1015647.1 YebC/PmpR family DNA-binding transcriptional regulator [Patescibacteria group bacterium]MBU1684778.1 YebC/PmpR family DNA-binding transcriptional regulator [Patescibacteria group bacterium]MBU1938212.1 YebC/PmpR family DNA-binding transcriptional regulator [Patescibacteria group bacterium]
MSGHSKWHSIKHKKGAADAKRGKIFTRHAALISIAARNGGDPEMNPALRLAIDNAKKDNVPSANIDKAIKRGTGEDKDAAQIEEVSYEGYGPGGVAVIVECLTDNKNRSYTNIRVIFNKHGGNLGTSGSVAWMFDRKGIISIDLKGIEADNLELAAIDAGATDIEREKDLMHIYTDPHQLHAIDQKMKAAGYKPEKAEAQLVPNQTVKIEDESTARKILNFMEALDDDQDVSDVSGNFDISDEMMDNINMPQ